jgi:hypothetical protein
MSYVTLSDFNMRYENSVPAADKARVETLLADACDMAADVTGVEYQSGVTVPGAVVAAVCNAVRRAYENPGGLQAETIGDYSWRAAENPHSGLYFTAAEVRAMRRAAGSSAVTSVGLEGMLPATEAAQYVNDSGSPEPILYYAHEDLY